MVILLVQNELQDMNKDQLKGTAELVQRWYPTEMIGTMHVCPRFDYVIKM